MFDMFVAQGGNFFDTADGYQFGESEEILGEFLGSDRDSFVVVTKYALGANADPKVSFTGNSRKAMVRSLEGSLRRLRTDYVDVFCVHSPDTVTSSVEIAGGLQDLVQSGKVLYGALSNFPAWRAARIATLGEVRGWSPLVALQVEYSLAERGAELELVPMAEAFGLGLMIWSPLGGGLLTGKYRQSKEGRLTDWKVAIREEDTDQKTATIDALISVARELGAEPSQVAMAWLRSRAGELATPVVPLVGPRDTTQLQRYLGALEINLSAEQAALLNRASAVPLGVPHESAAGALSNALGGDVERFRRTVVPVA
jgi:aryl-alcohol dehydrogenase-like predicted oxidoreductase